MTDTKTPLNLYAMFSTDKDSEENGVWLNIDDKTGFKIRFAGAKAVSELREKLLKPYATLVRVGGEIPEAKSEEIAIRVVAGGILADWKGIRLPVDIIDDEKVAEAMATIPEGKLITNEDGTHEYNPDVAYAFFKAVPRLIGVVSAYSTESQNFKNDAREDGAKN
jgi:hypothetical protein